MLCGGSGAVRGAVEDGGGGVRVLLPPASSFPRRDAIACSQLLEKASIFVGSINVGCARELEMLQETIHSGGIIFHNLFNRCDW